MKTEKQLIDLRTELEDETKHKDTTKERKANLQGGLDVLNFILN